LLGKIMRGLEATIHPVFVSYDHLTYIELLRLISKELGLASDGGDRLAIVDELREYLIAQHNKGHIVALLIDEAQNLSDEMFEDIRCLSNFETEKEKLLQIVLTGQPELEARLDQPNLRHIKQRIVIHCRLAPLKHDEVGRYIEVRLEEAGYPGKDLFNPDAIRQIAFYSGGIPRLINIICDNALLLAFAGSMKRVTTKMIQEVAWDLGLKNHSQVESQTSPPIAKSTDEARSTRLASLIDSIQLKTDSVRPEKSHLGWIPMGIYVALALGGAGGVLYSQQIRDYIRHSGTNTRDPDQIQEYNLARATADAKTFQQSSADKNRHLLTQDPNQNSFAAKKPPVTPRESAAAGRAPGDNRNSQRVEARAMTSKAGQTRLQDREVETKEKDSALGTFKVVGPFSFVRRTPRSDSEIIATLEPRTRVKVVSTTGDYFRVQASAEGRTIRGYVHREDAFFARADNGNGKERKTRNR
jgi:type II secretory pathway predicted ATPase ExeA